MKVSKRVVDEFVVCPVEEHPEVEIVLNRERAEDLWRGLAEALGKPVVEYRGCDNRYSHAAHAWTGSSGKKGFLYCTGRSFDAT